MNLITGQNNTGKTALLEALSLLLAQPNPSAQGNLPNTFRAGFGNADPQENFWNWLFPAKNQGLTMELKCELNGGEKIGWLIQKEQPGVGKKYSGQLAEAGGFTIAELEFTSAPILDAIGREAIAQTRAAGFRLHLLIRSGLSEEELSVTLYHEVLEAAAVVSQHRPESVQDLNEAGFERVARQMHFELGCASPENLNHMLQIFGFPEP